MSNPTHNDAYLRGVELFRTEQFEEARACFAQSVEAAPTFHRGHAFLGLCLARLDRIDEAIEANERCLEIDPTYDKAHNNLGECWRRKLKMETAIEHFSEAVRLKPEILDYQKNLAMTHLDTRRPDHAIPPLRRALALDGRDFTCASKLAECLYQTDDLDGAITVLESFMKRNRDHVQWPEMEARVKMLRRRREETASP